MGRHVRLGVLLAALSGCAAGTFLAADPVLAPASTPSISAEEEGSFGPGWGARGGLAAYIAPKTSDIPARPTFGGYFHFLDSDAWRLEAGFDVTPDLSNITENNLYLSFTGDYVMFIGSGGLFLKAGGGGVIESRGSDSDFFGLVEFGGGWWFQVSKEGTLYATAMLQLPMGEGGEIPATILTLGVSYDF